MPNTCGCGTTCSTGCITGCNDTCGSTCTNQNSARTITRNNRVVIPTITKTTINNEKISSIKTRGEY